MLKKLTFISLSLFLSSAFAYNEILLNCKVSSKKIFPDSGRSKLTSNLELMASIRIADGKKMVVISGEKSPFASPVFIFGFKYNSGDAIHMGEDLSNNSQFFISSDIKENGNSLILKNFYSFQVSRVTGDLMIFYEFKSREGNMSQVIEGNCKKIENKNKF